MEGAVSIPSVSNDIVKFDTIVGEGFNNTEVPNDSEDEVVYILSPNPYDNEGTVESDGVPEKPAEVAFEVPSFLVPSTEDDGGSPFLVEVPIEEVYAIDNNNNSESLSTLFHNLHSDVAGATDFISDLIEQKRSILLSESAMNDERIKFEKEKADFIKFMTEKKEEINLTQSQSQEYIRMQKERLKSSEEEFKLNTETKKLELSLAEETIKLANQRLVANQEHLKASEKLAEDVKNNEMETIRAAREKLESDIDQFNKERAMFLEKMAIDRASVEKQRELFEKNKELEVERIRNEQAELSSEKSQFEKHKHIEEKKIEFEKANLAKSAEKFKELVSKFNSGFQKLPENR